MLEQRGEPVAEHGAIDGGDGAGSRLRRQAGLAVVAVGPGRPAGVGRVAHGAHELGVDRIAQQLEVERRRARGRRRGVVQQRDVRGDRIPVGERELPRIGGLEQREEALLRVLASVGPGPPDLVEP